MAARSNPQIGLTGGIGSGKSTVASMLVKCGAVLIDTDAIAKSLTQAGGAAIHALRTAFGPTAIDQSGAMDRACMREWVFADLSAKTRLEAILHPMIGIECDRQATVAAGRPLVFDVPLLVESNRWRTRVDRVLIVDCSEATQVGRVTQRPGWSRKAVLDVIAQQANREARRAAADAVIYNESLTMAQLAQEVEAVWGTWMRVEQSRRSSGADPS
ncbi:MAG: dephospho-CoA kinase [Rhizobacter sp.]